jgi:mono/diheme cytochrome c family protein
MQKSMTFVVLCAVLAACSHGSQSSSATSTTATQASASAAPMASVAAVNGAEASAGARVYETNCSSCHQASGAGMPGTFPPLAGNPVLDGPASAVIHIVKDGLTGSITVNGTNYNGQMPAWGSTLSTGDIAAVITYVRSSWGNHGSAVTPAQVSAAK